MRGLVVVVCCVASLAVAPAALAQEGRRDPFRPLVGEEGSEVPAGTDTSQPSTATGTDTTGDPGETSEGTPNTGMPASDWTAVAYLLIVLGAAAVTLARLRRPLTPVPRPRRRT